MAIKAHYLQNKDGTKFYPYSHADATYTKYGEKVGDVLDALEEGKIDKEDGKSLSTNDYTDSDKKNLSTAYEHSQVAHARTDATKVEKSTTNGNIKINGNETVVYTHPSGTNPHGTTKNDIGLGNVNNTSDANKPVSTAQKTAIDKALTDAKAYTDTEIAELINGAPSTLDTLKEIADAMAENESIVKSLDEAIGTKANQTALNSHTGNTTVHITATERTNWNDANTKKHEHSNKSVLDGITSTLISTWNNITNKLDKTGDASNTTNTFSVATTRANLTTGEKLSTSLGKLAKWFSDLKTVAFTGSYNDLSNKPTIPSVGNGTITITQNGTTKGAFTTNQSGNTTIDLADTNTDTNTTYTAGRGITLGGTQFKLSDNCTTVTDWNNATTTGFYMSASATASNQPVSNAWFIGEVITYNSSYVRQILYRYSVDSNVAGTNCDRYERVKHNGSWGSWTNTSVRIAVPSNAKFTDTDTKATQTNTTTNADYRVVLSTNANDTTETNTLRKSANFIANPSTGAFYAKGYDRTDITGQTLDINTLNLSAGSPEIMRYIEKTNGGAANIKNIPVSEQPFMLDVELIRWASASDYVTKQTFNSIGDKTHEYVRYCTSGTWDSSWTKRTFTDNNTVYTHPAYTARTGVPTANATPSFGGTFQVSQPVSDATGHITALNNRTITIPSASATSSAAGLMSAADKTKLDGITSSADAVSVAQKLTSGTEIGTVTVNGTGTKLYAPTNTDTHYTTGLKVGASATATANAAATNGNVYLNVLDNTTIRDSHNIVGSGATTVTSDANGKITISSTNTTYTHPTSSGNKHIPSGGSSGQILRWSADGTAVWGNDNNTTYGVVSTTADGLAPKRDGSTSKFLRGDGTWAVPPDTNTTYSNFVKSGSGAKAGLVPAPSTTAGTTKYLREDGTWTVPPNTNTTYSNMTGATSSAAGQAGLVPAPASGKQTSFLRGDGTWVVPTNTTNTAGSTNSSSKLFLIGATSQSANPQTYSHDTAYVGTDGCLYSGGKRCDTEVMSATEPTGQVTGDFWLQSY